MGNNEKGRVGVMELPSRAFLCIGYIISKHSTLYTAKVELNHLMFLTLEFTNRCSHITAFSILPSLVQ